MNASGRLNTCKSRGSIYFGKMATGERVRNAYATYLIQKDSPWKRGLILYGTIKLPGLIVKTSVV